MTDKTPKPTPHENFIIDPEWWDGNEDAPFVHIETPEEAKKILGDQNDYWTRRNREDRREQMIAGVKSGITVMLISISAAMACTVIAYFIADAIL